MDAVTVRNGDEVPRTMVDVTMLSLRDLHRSHPIAFYELVMTCRSRDHVLFGDAPVALLQLSLIESVDLSGRARVHDCIRSIVVSATNGDGLDLSLQSPLDGGA